MFLIYCFINIYVKLNRFGCLFKFYKFNNWMLRLWKYINYYRNDKKYCYILKNYREYNWNKYIFFGKFV